MLCVPKDMKSKMSKVIQRLREARASERNSHNNAGATGLLLELFATSGISKLPGTTNVCVKLAGCLSTIFSLVVVVVVVVAVLEHVDTLLANDTKFLMFAHHKAVMNGLAHHLDKRGVGYIRIDGSTAQGPRASLVDRFQNEATCRVALLSITAAGVGLTLTAASLAVFAEVCDTRRCARAANTHLRAAILGARIIVAGRGACASDWSERTGANSVLDCKRHD
jgi:SNF2 family DNA or RNA helicase